jgi:hypothetical protein
MTLPIGSARTLSNLADAAPQPDFRYGIVIGCLVVSGLFVTTLVAVGVWLIRRRRRANR